MPIPVTIRIAIARSKHLAKMDPQSEGKPLHVVDGNISVAALNRSHVGPMEFRQLCKVFLGQPTIESQSAHAGRERESCSHPDSPCSHRDKASSGG